MFVSDMAKLYRSAASPDLDGWISDGLVYGAVDVILIEAY